MCQITDGLSNTIAMGEAAGGQRWLLSDEPAMDTPADPNHEASVPWVVGNIVPRAASFYRQASIYGTTAEALNKRAVTPTLFTSPL